MRILKSALILVALLLALPARAGDAALAADWDYMGLPDLSAEQKGRMDDLRWAFVRFSLPRSASINTLLVESAIVMAADKPDLAVVHQKMDQVSKLSDEIRRESIQMLAGFRALLKKDQTRVWDAMLLSNPEILFGRVAMAMGGGMGVGGGMGGGFGQAGQMSGGVSASGGMPMPAGPGTGAGMPAQGPALGAPTAMTPPCDPRLGNCGAACPMKEPAKTPKK